LKLQRLLVVPVVSAVFLASGVGVASADFVCPVFDGDSGAVGHNKHLTEIAGGDYTLFPGAAGVAPDGVGVDYPDGATNGDGTGGPMGDHSEPGDSDYTPLWNTN
jgi:hypothetical protein